jgi:hypothetical protein
MKTKPAETNSKSNATKSKPKATKSKSRATNSKCLFPPRIEIYQLVSVDSGKPGPPLGQSRRGRAVQGRGIRPAKINP